MHLVTTYYYIPELDVIHYFKTFCKDTYTIHDMYKHAHYILQCNPTWRIVKFVIDEEEE